MPGPAPRAIPPEIRWGLGDVGWGLLLFFTGQVATTLLALALMAATGGQDTLRPDQPPLLVVVLGVVGGWLGLIGWPVVATRFKGQGSLRKDFGLVFTWADVGWGVLAGFASLAISILLSLLWVAITGADAPSNAGFLAEVGTGPVVVLVLFATIAVGTPIAEELFFRGLLMRSLGKRWNVRVAVVGSSLLFGSLHATAGTSVGGALFIAGVTALYGLVLALLTVWRDGRLGGAITAHFVINGTQVLLFFVAGVR
ncbi:CPBP family intramembrane glutamic endopeptidase [Rhabdothermincola sediminis]|uniref:CPBP family intramembrane glutamic endopeptidase n=1 Tax=Rhabdothermincola sediminis TaxID=2751370 RepID=UPI001AA0A051|nr:CPBP family intramembrane glutamic endopeptidase [Rhabdothermincola sediminis]